MNTSPEKHMSDDITMFYHTNKLGAEPPARLKNQAPQIYSPAGAAPSSAAPSSAAPSCALPTAGSR
jgi:hypothetical protein